MSLWFRAAPSKIGHQRCEGPDVPVKQLSRRILDQILALNSEGIVVADASDPDFPVIYVNPAYEHLTGYSADEVLGSGWRLLEDDVHDPDVLGEIRTAMGRSESCETTLPDIHKDGTTWLSRVIVHPLYNARGDLEYYLCAQSPVPQQSTGGSGLEVGLLQRELRRARQQIASMDRIEPATGVFRYEYFLELARRDFRMARRDKRTVSVMMLQVNDLDVYRQTFGSKAADSCLRMVAAQVTGALRRSGDLCGRAGETTLAALVHGQDLDEARELGLRIAENVRGLGLHNPRAQSGRYITISVGIAGGSGIDEDPEILIGRAEDDLRSSAPVEEGSAQAG